MKQLFCYPCLNKKSSITRSHTMLTLTLLKLRQHLRKPHALSCSCHCVGKRQIRQWPLMLTQPAKMVAYIWICRKTKDFTDKKQTNKYHFPRLAIQRGHWRCYPQHSDARVFFYILVQCLPRLRPLRMWRREPVCFDVRPEAKLRHLVAEL